MSWQGVNDLSARPAATGPNANSVSIARRPQAQQTIVLNTLGDLTNRENRFAYSRFANDFYDVEPRARLPPSRTASPMISTTTTSPITTHRSTPNVFNTSRMEPQRAS